MKKENNKSNNGVVSNLKGLVNYDIPVYGIPTNVLNRHLDGGLTEGLYVLAGAPSSGKTTLSLQIADNIAKEGHDVLIFSLLTPRTELIAKSVSRTTHNICLDKNISLSNAKTTKGILTGSRYEFYSELELKLIDDAFDKYGEEAQNLYIHEGVGDFGVTQVREIIEEHIAMTGNKPVVFVDSLQELGINVGEVALELKKISRDFNIPVWTTSRISSKSYEYPVSLRSFDNEEITYLADVIIGIDLVEVETDHNPDRAIKLNILKNKYGVLRDKIRMTFHTKFNLFTK